MSQRGLFEEAADTSLETTDARRVRRLYWRGAYCYGVSSVSLYNPLAAPSALLHYDITLSPPVLWSGCQSQPILSMAARRGDLYLVWGGSVWYYDLDGTASVRLFIAPPLESSLDPLRPS